MTEFTPPRMLRHSAASDSSPDADSRPPVSIVVPVYNDPAGLEETADCLVDQTYPTDRTEILLVDNGSTDGTRRVADRFAADHGTVEVRVEADTQGSYAARNEGIRRASGEILAFVDADVTVDDDWLERAIETMEETDADYVGCNVEMVSSGDGGSLPDEYNRRSGFPIAYFLDELGFAPTCCLLVRRRVVDDVGPFDPRLVSGGDREFGHRVRDAGYDLAFAADVVAYHPTRRTVGEQLRKSRRIGRGIYQLHAYHPERYAGPLPCALNPYPYLPPRPKALRRRVDGWDELSVPERAGFYALAYAKSLTNGVGRLEEALRR